MQPMSWTFERQDGYLLVIAHGEWIFRQTHLMIEEVREVCRQKRCERVLVDFRLVRGLVTEEDRYRAGVEVADRLKDIRLAVVAPEERPSRFSEEVANRRGAKMRLLPTSTTRFAGCWQRTDGGLQ